MKRYKYIIDGQVLEGTAEEVITLLKGPFNKDLSNENYMKDVSDRVNQYYGSTLNTKSLELFLHGLFKLNLWWIT